MPTEKPAPRPLHRVAADSLLGLSLFLAFAFGLLGTPIFDGRAVGHANAAEMARVAAFTGPMVSSDPADVDKVALKPAILMSAKADLLPETGRDTALIMLALVFTALFSFNLALFRHLHRMYVAPRKRSKPANSGWSAKKARA